MDASFFAQTPITDLKDTLGVELYAFLIFAFVILIIVAAFKALKGGGRYSAIAIAFIVTAIFAIPPAGDGIINFAGNAVERITDQGNSALEEG